MSYLLIPIDNSSEWNSALGSCGAYDIYHRYEYHKVAQQQGEGEPFLFLYRQFDQCAALPILLRPLNSVPGLETSDLYDVTSVYGYPGAITSLPNNSPMADQFRKGFQKALREYFDRSSVVAFFTRTNPLIDTSWLFEGGAEVLRLSSTIAIDLTRTEKEQLDGMTKGHRYDIRKSYREGVVVEEDTDFRHLPDFIKAYNETMRRVEARDYYFFSEDYYWQLKEILGDSLKLYIARIESRIVSASMFLFADKIIQYHLSGTFSDAFEYNGAKAILDVVRKWGSGQGYDWLHLGGGVGSAEDSLFRFKSGFSRCRFPFMVVRMVTDNDRYQEACRIRNGAIFKKCNRQEPGNYFPAYRAPWHP